MYAQQAAADVHTPNIDAVQQSVLSVIGSQRTLLARDDDLLNAQGLTWFASQDGVALNLWQPQVGPAGLPQSEQELPLMHFLIVGDSAVPFREGLSLSQLRSFAQAHGFHLVRTWRISDRNDIEVWVSS